MGISGSQKAPKYALLGVARLGATRLDYYPPIFYAQIDGVSTDVRVENLQITQNLDGLPDLASFTLASGGAVTPVRGNPVVFGLGAIDASHRLFGGHILTTTQVYEVGKPANVAWHCSAISWEFLLNQRKVTQRWTSTSVTDIVTDVMSDYTSGFSLTNVASGLDTLEEFTATNEDVTDVLDRLAKRIGAFWYVDYAKGLHFFLTENDYTAHSVTDSDRATFALLGIEEDLSQVRTRVYMEGGGAQVTSALDAGETLIPVDDASWYNAAGGTVVIGPQRVTYTGVIDGGDGAVLGTGVQGPSTSIAAAARIGTGLSSGNYKWKTSFVTAAGETLCGPESLALTLGGVVTAPASAPTAAKRFGGSLSAGAYQWKTSFVDSAGGETTAGSASASITLDAVADPGSIPNIVSFLTGGSIPASSLSASATYGYAFTFYNATDGVETALSPVDLMTTGGSGPTDNAGGVKVSDIPAAPSGFVRRWYRTVAGGSTYKLMSGANEGWNGTFTVGADTYYYDIQADGALGATAPGSSTATYRSANLTSIPVSADANVVSRRIYRTAAGGSTFKLVTTIANNSATTYTDTLADASLGANEPSSNTAVYKQASLTAVPVSPDVSVTSRKIYRTEVGGSTFKLVATIGNNTATTYTDSTPDASLGATEPSTDTSGLSIADGIVTAGTSTLPMSSTSPFSSTGGWVRIQSQVVRYTGKTSTTLTGIPALGLTGALASSVRYGNEVLVEPQLTGVPASGAGAVLYPVALNEAANLLVMEEDGAAQTALAADLGSGDGIREEYLQDNRLSETEASSRAAAHLALVKDALVTVRYTTRDQTTRIGRAVTFSLSAPTDLTGTYKIQRVTLSQFDPLGHTFPLRTVEASSRRLTFDALLRLIRSS